MNTFCAASAFMFLHFPLITLSTALFACWFESCCLATEARAIIRGFSGAMGRCTTLSRVAPQKGRQDCRQNVVRIRQEAQKCGEACGQSDATWLMFK